MSKFHNNNNKKKKTQNKKESSKLKLMRYKNFNIMKLFCKTKVFKRNLECVCSRTAHRIFVESSFRGNRKLCFNKKKK